MVSPTSIKIVRKAVKILRGEMIMAGTQPIQKPVKRVTFSSQNIFILEMCPKNNEIAVHKTREP